MTVHSRTDALVATAIDFDLSPAERRAMSDHLATCATCRALAAGYSRDASTLRDIALVAPPESIRTAVMGAAARPATHSLSRWKLLVAAVLLAALTIGALLVGSLLLRRPPPLGAGPLIVYQVRGTFADIFTLDIDTGARTPLGSLQLDSPIGGQRITWATDGRSAFVYTGEGDYLQAQVDLVARRIVPLGAATLESHSDEVSPTGDRWARLVGDAEQGTRLALLDLAGAEVLNVPLPRGSVMGAITWAPDETSVLLTGCASCAGNAKEAIGDQHLFLVPLDGRPIRQLTDEASGTFGQARFSREGSTLAVSAFSCRGACTGGIATIRVADGEVNPLTMPEPDVSPAWSPDGGRIAFQRGGVSGGIFVMDRDGSNVIRLTTASSGEVDRDQEPVWSPDGSWIAFKRDPSDTSLGDLWIVPSEGGEATLLAENAVADWGPTVELLALVPTAPPVPPSPATPPSASASKSASASPATSASAPATGDRPLGGGLLLVHQLDGTSSETATTETIFTVNIGTGSQTVLGTIPVDEMTCCPTLVQWSADRQRAFVSSNFLRAIADIRSGTVEVARRAPAGQFKEAVSSRGDLLARVDEVSGARPAIVVADLAGHEIARLEVPDVRGISSLAWSPDDATLAVVGCGPCDLRLGVERLLLVPVDGSPARRLADTAAEVTVGPPLGDQEFQSRTWEAAWSPDGTTLAVTEGTCIDDHADLTYRCTGILSTIDIASGHRAVLLDRDEVLRAPSWAPDGRRLALGMAEGEGEAPQIRPSDVVSGDPCLPCRVGLYLIDRDGGNLTRLADGDDAADWSPDGTWLAFRRFDWDLPWGTARAQVWVVPAAGGEARLIANHAAAGW